MKKQICKFAMGLALIGALAGCGKKNKTTEADDPYAAEREDVVQFVNVDLASIVSEKDDAVGIYNAYFTSDSKDPQAFLTQLQDTAIPEMQNFVDELTAIETKTTEVGDLKNLYLQGAQKQLDAMNKVASAISEENPDYLTEADQMITDSKSYFTQYESQLKLISIDCSITINGSFDDATAATEAATEASTEATGDGSITPVE